ncbi:MAG TPA: hypothetical protein EYH45_00970 [Candidatus Caldiarchaeum subterraneum]|uniref:MPN domain-containing protein n=1 Tax=Caldiarchaeum subterraneum TaxID=311458 RepID=A0A832ZXG0_CALS0|nr:hypothetical protein [Aigarchaeota archaeon]HIQ29116.1 hypothetical protein [Candidatus Caldarchaeum subterraneum]
MRARIYPLALGKIVKHSLTNPSREVAGLLIGQVNGQVLEIWDAVTGEQHGTTAFVHLDEAVMAEVADELLRSGSGLYIVGWYHSHPGFDVFLSPTDVETQRRYQMMFPKAVALVIDPVEYSRTRKISSLRFKIFRINKQGRVVAVPTSIGVHRNKLIESTIKALETLDIRHIIDVDSNAAQKRVLEGMGIIKRRGGGEEQQEAPEGMTGNQTRSIYGARLFERAKKILRNPKKQ